MYLKELDGQINAAAEIDSKQFWRLIKSKWSKSTTSMSAEIKFDGVTYRDPQEINKQWGNYFKNLYTPDEDESFDDNVKLQVENELHEIKQHLQVEHDTVKVDRHLITEAIKCSKGGKACGKDRVYYENFIYGRSDCTRYSTQTVLCHAEIFTHTDCNEKGNNHYII